MKFRIFGDSHTRQFKLTKQIRSAYPALAKIEAEVHDFAAGSVAGFGKRNSTLQIGQQITGLLTDDEDYLVLAFGQVDVEMGLYYRWVVKGDTSSTEELFDRLVDTYVSAILTMRLPREKLVIKGINPSVLAYSKDKALTYTARIITENVDDPAEAARYTEKLVELFPRARMRTGLHRTFNKRLKAACERNGLRYFDLFSTLLDPETKLIRTRFIPVKQDHHLSDDLQTRWLHWQKLLRTVSTNDRQPPPAV